MNNVVLGNDRFTYYETISGGQGACPDSDGPSAVHVAMSNTLNTPIEALELAYPLRVERYALRLGLGRRRTVPGGTASSGSCGRSSGAACRSSRSAGSSGRRVLTAAATRYQAETS